MIHNLLLLRGTSESNSIAWRRFHNRMILSQKNAINSQCMLNKWKPQTTKTFNTRSSHAIIPGLVFKYKSAASRSGHSEIFLSAFCMILVLNEARSWPPSALTTGSTIMSDKKGKFGCNLCSTNLPKKIIRRTVPTVPMMGRFFTPFHKLTVYSRLENVPIQPTSSYWNQSQIFSARSARNDESLSHSVHSLVRWMSPPPTKSIVNISAKVLTIGCKQLPLQYLPI